MALFVCNKLGDQRLLNCGARRAFFNLAAFCLAGENH